MTRSRPVSVKVRAPASSANLGPGYDVFAVALEKPADTLELRVADSSSLTVDIKVRGARTVPSDAKLNAAGAVVLKMAEDFGLRSRISMVIEKGVPIGVGLGSSAASSAAAAFAMNECFRLRLNGPELVGYAARGEFVSSGVEHYDNVSASLLGGFTVTMTRPALEVARFDPPEELRVCLATPTVKLPDRKTEYARSILPKMVELERLVHNTAAASTLVAGFAKKDIEMIGRGMEDQVVERARAAMIPGYERVRGMAFVAGASGVCISGAGPTVLAIVDSSEARPSEVLKEMKRAFESEGVEAEGYTTTVGRGARRVDR